MKRVREGGAIRKSLHIAIGIDWEGRRQILAVELSNRESINSWKDFFAKLRKRGLSDVEFVVSDDHPGLRKAIAEVLPESVWQRCYVHFYAMRSITCHENGDDDCLKELRWLYDRARSGRSQKKILRSGLSVGRANIQKLCSWVEDNIEETFSFYQLPMGSLMGHHKHMKSTNMLERLNEEIKRRTHIARIFPQWGELFEAGKGFVRRDLTGTGSKRTGIWIWVFTRTQKAGNWWNWLFNCRRQGGRPPASYRWANSRSASLPLLVPRCHERLNCRTWRTHNFTQLKHGLRGHIKDCLWRSLTAQNYKGGQQRLFHCPHNLEGS